MSREKPLFTRLELEHTGFEGWIPARDLCRETVPKGVGGVYIAYRAADEPPTFLPKSTAGTHKGRDPTIPIVDLQGAWVAESRVVYIGKAHATSTSDLQRRVWAFVRQGRGGRAGHWGGRATWQLVDGSNLLITWMATDRDPRAVEREMLAAFVKVHGKLPFANLAR
jgi:hypothetical protein